MAIFREYKLHKAQFGLYPLLTLHFNPMYDLYSLKMAEICRNRDVLIGLTHGLDEAKRTYLPNFHEYVSQVYNV